VDANAYLYGDGLGAIEALDLGQRLKPGGDRRRVREVHPVAHRASSAYDSWISRPALPADVASLAAMLIGGPIRFGSLAMS
jgi:hypothetical protein